MAKRNPFSTCWPIRDWRPCSVTKAHCCTRPNYLTRCRSRRSTSERGAGSIRRQGLAAAKPEVIVGMAVRVQDAAAVPERCAPAAPVLMRVEGIEDKPASLHFGVTQRLAAATGHL